MGFILIPEYRGVWPCLQIIAAATDVEQKKEIYVPHNVLPLDATGASHAIMQLDEVRVCLLSLCL